MVDHSDASPLIAPAPVAEPSEIDLEAGPGEQIQCRICLESDGRDFIAPCKCKGTSKYVHRECLDHWRAVKVWFPSIFCFFFFSKISNVTPYYTIIVWHASLVIPSIYYIVSDCFLLLLLNKAVVYEHVLEFTKTHF